MGPGEVLAAIALFVGMPWATFTGIAKVMAAKKGGDGESMRASELKAMIQDSVEEAVAPFRRRIETLEAIAIDEDAGQSRLDVAVLADALGPLDRDEPAAVRRRTRE